METTFQVHETIPKNSCLKLETQNQNIICRALFAWEVDAELHHRSFSIGKEAKRTTCPLRGPRRCPIGASHPVQGTFFLSHCSSVIFSSHVFRGGSDGRQSLRQFHAAVTTRASRAMTVIVDSVPRVHVELFTLHAFFQIKNGSITSNLSKVAAHVLE